MLSFPIYSENFMTEKTTKAELEFNKQKEGHFMKKIFILSIFIIFWLGFFSQTLTHVVPKDYWDLFLCTVGGENKIHELFHHRIVAEPYGKYLLTIYYNGTFWMWMEFLK